MAETKSSSWQDPAVARNFLDERRAAIPFGSEQVAVMLRLVRHFRPEPRHITPLRAKPRAPYAPYEMRSPATLHPCARSRGANRQTSASSRPYGAFRRRYGRLPPHGGVCGA
jgi:hypothetical protein